MLIALAMSVVVAVGLAVVVPTQVERHLINGEVRSLTRIAAGFAEAGMIRAGTGASLSCGYRDLTVRLEI